MGALWYKTILQNTHCLNDGQGTHWEKPEGFATGTDALNWAVVLPPGSIGMQIRAISDNAVLSTVDIDPGLNYGAPSGVLAGEQRLELLDPGGNVVISATGGRRVEASCPDGIYNMNYHIVGPDQGKSTGIGQVNVAGGMASGGGVTGNGSDSSLWRRRHSIRRK